MKQIVLIVNGGCVLEAHYVPKGYKIVINDQDDQESYDVPTTIREEMLLIRQKNIGRSKNG